jgi:4-hydroxy-tetrahydrodipicolinate reductase
VTRAVLIGASGRMGAAIVRANLADGTLASALTIVAAVGSPGGKSAGRDLGDVAGVPALGVRVATELPPDLAGAQVAIDFSRPELSLRALNVCRAARVPIVIGTTGHGAEFEARVAAAARDIAVLVAPNTSIGVAVAQELVRIAAAALPSGFDIEIVEAHHKHKIDAPSGTALALADSAAKARGLDPNADTLTGRVGQQARRAGEIGIASLRAGDIVGSHTVLFAGTGERLTIGHEATDRSIFAHGAIRAAGWLAAQKPGRYSMANVLGLKTVT